MEQRHLDAAAQLAARAERLLAETLERSKPLPLAHPKAPERFKPGTRLVHPGPRACRRWGGR